MYDALYFACRDKLLKQERNGPVRRAIILLSDGDDNLSHVTREEAIEMAQRAEVIIYTISTNVSAEPGQRRQSSGTHRRCHRRARFLSLPTQRCSQRLRRNSGRTAQPVRALLQACRVPGGWPLSHHRDSGAKPQRPARTQPPRLLRTDTIDKFHGGILRNSASQKARHQTTIPGRILPVAKRRKD